MGISIPERDLSPSAHTLLAQTISTETACAYHCTPDHCMIAFRDYLESSLAEIISPRAFSPLVLSGHGLYLLVQLCRHQFIDKSFPVRFGWDSVPQMVQVVPRISAHKKNRGKFSKRLWRAGDTLANAACALGKMPFSFSCSMAKTANPWDAGRETSCSEVVLQKERYLQMSAFEGNLNNTFINILNWGLIWGLRLGVGGV